jgi:hypothetical protein
MSLEVRRQLVRFAADDEGVARDELVEEIFAGRAGRAGGVKAGLFDKGPE